MRAKYEIYSVITDVVVDTVILDVYGDPSCPECYADAVEAASYTDWDSLNGPMYKARFAGYAGPELEVPFELIMQLMKVVNASQKASISRDAPCIAVIGQVLQALGYVDRDDNYQYHVADLLKGLHQ